MWDVIMRNIAFEGRLFVVSAVQYVASTAEREAEPMPGWPSVNQPCIGGGSIIIDPFGKVLAGPMRGSEGLLTATIDTSLIPQARYDLDVVGHYSRGDIFQLVVNEKTTDVQFTK